MGCVGKNQENRISRISVFPTPPPSGGEDRKTRKTEFLEVLSFHAGVEWGGVERQKDQENHGCE